MDTKINYKKTTSRTELTDEELKQFEKIKDDIVKSQLEIHKSFRKVEY